MTTRRVFLQQGSGFLFLPFALTNPLSAAKDLRCEVAIIGGGLGGVAAALAACRAGRRVIMTEETDWIGGQVTAQAVPLDEHRWIESFGSTRSYREYRSLIRQYYRDHYPLTATARARWNLNPGEASVSRLCHEPRVSVAVLTSMLAPYLSSGRLTLLRGHKPIAADAVGDNVRSVTVRDLESGRERIITAPYFIDATETGELLPLTGAEYVTGFESRRETGEPHAPESAQPLNMQAITWCFAMDHLAGEDHTIDQPAEWKYWRDYVPPLKPAWPGKLLSWEQSVPQSLTPRRYAFDPEADTQAPGPLNFMIYRRLLARQNFLPGTIPGHLTVVNWPMNDYFGGPVIEVGEAEVKRHLDMAKQLSLSLLYWLQTEAPRPDGGQGWKGLRLRPDVVETDDGLAKYPYIRESRRIKAEFTILEQHVGTEARVQLTGKKPEELTAEEFPDSVGVGSYRIDLHMSTGGDNFIDISSLPFQIPLGALIPRRVENLIPACKNIGTTHITNGCYRLHQVEWNIGEAAGALVAQALEIKQSPRRIRRDRKLLGDFQSTLVRQGFELSWPKIRPV